MLEHHQKDKTPKQLTREERINEIMMFGVNPSDSMNPNSKS